MFVKTEDGSTYVVDDVKKTVCGPGIDKVPYVSMGSCVLHCALEMRVILDGAVKSLLTSPVIFAHL